MDIFYEGMFLEETTSVDKPSTQPESSSTTITYVVKNGNTLSQIARLYNTTVANIVSENDISNPNLIFPGEVLLITINDDDSQRATSIRLTYIVQSGDTLTAIARRYETTVASIVTENNIANPNLIYPGEVLRITISNTSNYFIYVIQAGDTLSEIARKYRTTVNELVQINGIRNPNVIYVNERIRIPR